MIPYNKRQDAQIVKIKDYINGKGKYVTGEGTNITLENTVNTPFNNIILNGNTSQNTTTGKNLLKFEKISSNGISFDNNIIKIVNPTSYLYNNSTVINNTSLSGQKISIAMLVNGVFSGSSPDLNFIIHTNKTGYKYRYQITNKNTNYDNVKTVSTIDLGSDEVITTTYMYIQDNSITGTDLTLQVMILEGEYTIDTIPPFEPYTNGASPNPDYPQEIHCVKGNNVVKISNGSEETDYKLNLGTIELNAIANFKDYFKKENGKWYKVEKIKSIIADGTNYLCKYMFPNRTFFIYSNAEKHTLQDAFKISGISLFSNYLISKTYTAVFDNGEIGVTYNVGTGEIGVNVGISSNMKDINTWLSTHNLMIKYILQTPNQIEITDTTLINQLNEISQAVSYDDTTNISQTNANLPFIINAEAVKKLL